MAEELDLSDREDVIRIKEHQEHCKGALLLTPESLGSFLFRGTRAVCQSPRLRAGAGVDFCMVVDDCRCWGQLSREAACSVRGWPAAHLLCLSFSSCFCLVSLGGQIVLIRAGLGTGWIGRKRTECISWDGFSQEYKNKGQDGAGSQGTGVPVELAERPWHARSLASRQSCVMGAHSVGKSRAPASPLF